MYKPAILCLCSLIALTGCQTTANHRRAGQTPPPDWQAGEDAPPPLIPGAPDIPLPPTDLPPPVVATDGKSSPSTAPVRLGNNAAQIWVSTKRWALDNGLREPRAVPFAGGSAYALTTTHGEFTFQPGSLTAYWNGLELRLGFAPQISSGEIFLHVLDTRKTLETLARGLTVAASPRRVIVIDPGHGGKNTGARSVLDGRQEKDFTLDWALRLAPLLEQRGWHVMLTRTNDVDISLPDRVAFANEQRADLFLSLHFNFPGSGNREPAGLETYVLTPTGMPSSITRGYPDDVREIFPNNTHDADNLRYAVRLHRAMLQVNGNNDRGVRHARFLGVLRGQNCPAVLIEGGYLSSSKEAQLIALPVYRQRLAEAVANALQ